MMKKYFPIFFSFLITFDLIAYSLDTFDDGSMELAIKFVHNPLPIPIINDHYSFEKDPFYFELGIRDFDYDSLRWQISKDPEFKGPNPEWDHTQDSMSKIYLDEKVTHYLKTDEEYYFRFKVSLGNQWSFWSTGYAFHIAKPKTITDLNLEKLSEKTYRLAWKSSEPGLRYHIFGSSTLNFTPISEGDETAVFLFTTEENYALVDDSYRHYRIIAEKNGRFSLFSSPVTLEGEMTSSPTSGEEKTESHIPTAKPENPLPIDYGYTKSPHVSQEVWDSIAPYLLPYDHPLRLKLDRIFNRSRATANRKSLKKAGFRHTKAGKWSGAVVAKHSKLKGYLVKLYTDNRKGVEEWRHWKHRIEGALAIKEAINKFGYQHFFKVPKKWIYPLPDGPEPKKGSERRHFILVVEDMHILSKNANYHLWRTSAMTKARVEAIYKVLEEAGLSDTVYAFNLPFTKQGRQAFIDTEFYHHWPVHYNRLDRYFSKEMREYWKQLTR